MPHSFNKHLYHITFATKNRERNLHHNLRKRLCPYIHITINNSFGQSYIVNGVDDHLHILCEIKAKHSVAEAIRKIKSETSKWISREFGEAFQWQEGYYSFSVSQSQIQKVYQYIERQEEHHRAVTFDEEYQSFLQRHS